MSEIEWLASVAEATAGESDEGFRYLPRAEARKVVRAILTSMREPSEGTLSAVYDADWHFDEGADRLAKAFVLMIDHILNQDEGLGHHGPKDRDRA